MVAAAAEDEVIIDCSRCDKKVRIVLSKDGYDYIVNNIDSDSLHECFVKERLTD
jgi:hypothetical protein